jgi:hypothetical protein
MSCFVQALARPWPEPDGSCLVAAGPRMVRESVDPVGVLVTATATARARGEAWVTGLGMRASLVGSGRWQDRRYGQQRISTRANSGEQDWANVTR